MFRGYLDSKTPAHKANTSKQIRRSALKRTFLVLALPPSRMLHPKSQVTQFRRLEAGKLMGFSSRAVSCMFSVGSWMSSLVTCCCGCQMRGCEFRSDLQGIPPECVYCFMWQAFHENLIYCHH